jgi:hypothetical protein
MTRSRLVLITSSAIVGLGTLAALGALVLDPARAAVGPLPAAALALPATSRYVIGFDVPRFLASPLYERLTRKQPEKDIFKDLREQVGVDPRRDVDRIVFAGARGHAMAAMVFGRFDRYRLGRALETRKGVTWKTHAGLTVYFMGEARNTTHAVAFLDDQTLVLGDREGVLATLDNHAGAGSLRSNAALIGLLGQVKAGSTLWMVGDAELLSALPSALPGSRATSEQPSQTMNLPRLKGLIATGEFDPALDLDVIGETEDEAAARNLADLVRGGVALISLQAAQKPELRELATAISVTTDVRRVRVNVRLPYALLDTLPGAQPAQVAGAAKAPAR